MRVHTLNTPERPEDLGIKERGHSHDDDGSQRRLGDVVEERGQEVQRQQHQHTCGGRGIWGTGSYPAPTK